eukprot:1584-Alexandrium_andersonii.AAC.1
MGTTSAPPLTAARVSVWLRSRLLCGTSLRPGCGPASALRSCLLRREIRATPAWEQPAPGMAIAEASIARGLMAFVDWAAPRFRDCGKATIATVAFAIAIEAVVPLGWLITAFLRHPSWPSGRPRFVV